MEEKMRKNYFVDPRTKILIGLFEMSGKKRLPRDDDELPLYILEQFAACCVQLYDIGDDLGGMEMVKTIIIGSQWFTSVSDDLLPLMERVLEMADG